MPEAVTIRVHDGRIYVKAPYHYRLTLKDMGGRWEPKTKEWHYAATLASAEAIARAFKLGGYGHDDAFGELLEQARGAYKAREKREAEGLPPIPGATDAWNHQRQAYWFATEQQAVMLAMDMGTGKTRTAIGLAEGWGCQRVLVLCPRNVVGVWPSELELHGERRWRAIAPNLKGTVQARAEFVAKEMLLAETRKEPYVVIVNHEASWRTSMEQLLLAQDWDLVIVDESHRAKSAGGKFSLFLVRLREKAAKRLCLTGTPMPHSPLDVYGQYRFLDPGIYGTSVNRFKQRYAITQPIPNNPKAVKIVGWQNEEELAQRFGSIAYVCKAEDVLDLEEPVHAQRIVELEPKSRRVYKELADDFISEVEEGTVTAANGGVKVLRLQQITSGYVKTEAGDEVELGGEKEALLADVLEDLHVREPVVVFCRFHHDLDAIRRVAEAQGRRVGEVSGRTSPGRADYGLTEQSKMREDIDLVAVQIQAGGVGIDLTRARYGIYYSVGHSLGDYEQSVKRIHRPGQNRLVEYIHLIARNTVDRTVYRALREKKDITEAIIEAARRGEL